MVQRVWDSEAPKRLAAHPVAAGANIEAGQVLEFTAAGEVQPAAANSTQPFAGFADESYDNRNGAAGAVHIRTISEGVLIDNLTASGMAGTDVVAATPVAIGATPDVLDYAAAGGTSIGKVHYVSTATDRVGVFFQTLGLQSL